MLPLMPCISKGGETGAVMKTGVNLTWALFGLSCVNLMLKLFAASEKLSNTSKLDSIMFCRAFKLRFKTQQPLIYEPSTWWNKHCTQLHLQLYSFSLTTWWTVIVLAWNIGHSLIGSCKGNGWALSLTPGPWLSPASSKNCWDGRTACECVWSRTLTRPLQWPVIFADVTHSHTSASNSTLEGWRWPYRAVW